MTKLAMFAAATLLAAAPAMAQSGPEDGGGAGYLGVRLQRIEGGLAEAIDMAPDSGVLLSQVESGSPAEKAGLSNGDIITKVGTTSVGTPDELRDAVRSAHAGEKVKISYLRDGKARTSEVELGAAPGNAPFPPPMMRERMRADRDDDDAAPTPRAGRDRMREHMRDIREMRLGREHGWLGVSTQPLTGELGEYFGAKDGGALVSEVVDESPARKLGLKAGDVIVKVDGEKIGDPGDLRREVGRHDEPAEVEIAWLREGKSLSGKVQLEVRDGLAFFGGDDGGMPGMGDFHWMSEDGPMRERVHSFRMRADDDAQKAIDELREQVAKLRAQVEKLQDSK